MSQKCPKCGYYDYDDGWCGACGYESPRQAACDRCGEDAQCEEIPMMGYTEFLCRQCAAAAYRMGEAV